MLRAVTAVLLAVALLAVATPAIQTARVQAADGEARAAATRLAEAARAVRERNDPVPPGARGARRVLTLSLPRETFGTNGLVEFAVGPGPGEAATGAGTAVTWRVEGGTTHRLLVPSLRIRPASCPREDRRLRFHEGGTHRVVLGLVAAEGRPVVTVARGFKYRNGTRRAHARDAGQTCGP